MTPGAPVRARWERVAIAAAASLFAVFYVAQYWWLAPNHTDDGLILTYIDDMAHGQLPYWDFVDAYGLFNWVLPVGFYVLAGNAVWGVRVAIILVKLTSIWLAYDLVRRATDWRHGLLAAVWVMVLFAQPWQSMQTAYAFVNVVPLVLGAWHFMVHAPLANPRNNIAVAGILTTLAIWTKLNTGLFLFAGGLFAYFFFLRARVAPGAESAADVPPAHVAWFRRARLLGIGAYGLLFCFFIRQHVNAWFVAYLVLPLLLVLGVAARRVARTDEAPGPYLRPFFDYLGWTVALSLFVWIAYYRRDMFAYARELAGILSSIRYTAPFPDLGKPSTYVGLNEYYWLQLPWFLSAGFACFCVMAGKLGPLTFGGRWEERRATVMSLFVLATLHSFVMYARADETHIFQALLLVAPVFFVVLYHVEAFLLRGAPRFERPVRWMVLLGGLLYATSIAVVPTFELFDLGPGPWHARPLAHLRYRPRVNPYVRDYTQVLTDNHWDKVEDAAATYIDSISEPREEILVMTANRLLHLDSDTRPLGGRYHFYFYLLSVGLIDAEAFRRLVPREVIDDLLLRPPRVIVGAYEQDPAILTAVPELRWMLERTYVLEKKFRHIFVHELRIRGKPRARPFRSANR